MIKNIFGTPILITDLPNHYGIKEEFSKYLKEDKYFETVQGWNCNVETTYNTDSAELPWNMFIESVMFCVYEYIEEFKFKSQPQMSISCWANRYKNNQYQEVHNHLSNNNAISLSYMMDLPENSGDFVFYKEGNDFWHTVGVSSLCDENSTIMSNNRFTPKVREGSVILFPSYLDHYVTYNKSQNTRATISANIQFMQ